MRPGLVLQGTAKLQGQEDPYPTDDGHQELHLLAGQGTEVAAPYSGSQAAGVAMRCTQASAGITWHRKRVEQLGPTVALSLPHTTAAPSPALSAGSRAAHGNSNFTKNTVRARAVPGDGESKAHFIAPFQIRALSGPLPFEASLSD